MSPTIKNIATILILITLAVGAYYYFAQTPDDGSMSASDAELQAMLAKTSIFIERSAELDQMKIDTSLLEDPRFRSLVSYSKPVKDIPVGRPDPFASVSGSSGVE